ncbi:MAG: hypothetical protein QOH25_1006 [Acidobacteriota bacterium]|jgi:hypothetical protein|nr:hypothetical protein [Acidobacteriota bacterium]
MKIRILLIATLIPLVSTLLKGQHPISRSRQSPYKNSILWRHVYVRAAVADTYPAAIVDLSLSASIQTYPLSKQDYEPFSYRFVAQKIVIPDNFK